MDDSASSISSTLLTGFTNLAEKIGGVIYSAVRWLESNNDTVSEYATTFVEFGQFLVAVNKLKGSHFIFTDDIDSELANEICTSENVEHVVENYYFSPTDDKAISLIDRCKSELESESDSRLFDQIIHAYNNGHYQLACIGLFALIDGVLSDLSKNTTTKFKERVNIIKSKVTEKTRLSDLDKKTIVICLSMDEVKESLFKNVNFSNPEPPELNRHWLLHGRTDEDRNRLDFIKEMLFLDAIQYIGNLQLPTDNEN